MSVALSIQPRGTSAAAPRIVPVATQDVFKSYWVPASETLGLKWVPLFETGIPLAKEEVPDVLQELRALDDWIRRNAPETAALIGARLQRLIAELGALVESLEQVDVFIG
jgi:hypothetical protein